MSRTMKIQYDGKEVEVELPEGVLTSEEVAENFMRKETFMPEVDRRVKAQLKGLVKREDLLGDEAFLSEALGKQGKELFDPTKTKKGKGALDDEALAQRLAEAQEGWRKKELAPVMEKLTGTEKAVSKLRDRILDGQILQSALNAGVKEAFLKPPAEGTASPIVSMLRGTFGFDPEHDNYFVRKGEEDFEFSAKPDEGHPFKTVSEFITDWAGRKENADFVDVERKRGPGLGGPGKAGKQSGRDVVLTPAEAGDHATWTAAEERATKQGGRVITAAPPNPLAGGQQE